jgi:hypothetical protein
MSGYMMNFKRKEIKYLMNEDQYKGLRAYLDNIAEVDEYGKTRINNIYFDTPSFSMIRTSLEKPLYKEKLRLRTYGHTDSRTNSFIEIKKKYKGIVYKRRINGQYKMAYDYLVNDGEPLEESQISAEIEELRRLYKNPGPAMRISYDRIAMAGKEDKNLRITFDTNITWDDRSLDLASDENGHQILKKGEVLMELKVPGAVPEELSKKMSELGIFPTSFSKYGRGYTDMIRRKASKPVFEPQIATISEREVRAYA